MVPIISNKAQVATVDMIQLSIPASTPLILDSGCVFQYLEELWKNTDVLALVVVVHSPSHVQLFATPWTAAFQASLSLTISQSLPKFMFIALVMPSSHLIPWHRLLLLPSIFLSIRDFSNESAVHIRWPKYWRFSFSISPSNKYPGLISFRIDWFDLLTIQGTLKCLLQHHNSKTSILWHSAFFAFS